MLPLKDENPTFRTPWVTFALIAVNVAVFVGPQSSANPEHGDRVAIEWAAIPCEVVTGDPITVDEVDATFSGDTASACDLDPGGVEAFPDKPVRFALILSMFMHAGWGHLLGNMWFLWIFGNNIEDHLGHVRYLIFYLLGGLAAAAAHVFAASASTIPVVGASGAVAAVMGAYAVWFPNAPIRTFLFIILLNIKAKWWLGFWLVSQFFTGPDSRIAWLAHVGGFAFGAVVGLLIRGSVQGQRRVFTAQHRNAQPWDSTGGAGPGPYARPHRLRAGR